MFGLISVFFASVLIGWFISFPIIWILRVFRVCQHVREEGPASHIVKTGTPTMGGIAILLTLIAFSLILINVDVNLKYAALLGLTVGFSLLGFTDDLIKIRKRQNTGLLPSEKFLGQFLIAMAFAAALIFLGHAEQVTGPAKDLLQLNDPYLYLPFIALVIISTANAVNLTDGLDGLAPGLLTIAFFVLGLIAFGMQANDEAITAMVAAGAVLSFLWFNFHPADVFMGDVGSLGLGALLGGLAVLLHKELLLVIIGGVFVIETLSVMIQVSIYKIFKVRLFRMSPIHHHFELLGMPELAVVIMFYVFGIAFAVLGFFLSGAI